LRHIYYLSAVILPTFGNSNGRIENTYIYEESSHIFNLFNRLSDRLPCANGGRALLSELLGVSQISHQAADYHFVIFQNSSDYL